MDKTKPEAQYIMWHTLPLVTPLYAPFCYVGLEEFEFFNHVRISEWAKL